MRRIITCLLLCISLFSQAQKKDKNAEKIAKTITAEDMKKHLYIIASKEMGGRDTPSPGQEKAANYIEDHFKSLGLLPGNKGSYRQYFPLYKDSVVTTAFKINGVGYELNKDFQPQLANYSGEMRFSEIVFVGFGITDDKRDDYKDIKVAGKLVVVLDGVPEGYTNSQPGARALTTINGKMTTAMNKGAVALIVVNTNFPRTTFNAVSNWSMNSYKASQSLFTFSISPGVAAAMMGEDGKNILDKTKAALLTPKTYKADIDLGFSKASVTTKVSNVMAMLEGTDKKDEYVFITAHYDHVGKRGDSVIYYGADDDGSGTTGVLELAEAFAKAKATGKGPRRNIVFMTVCGEEKGLWGSEYYTNHPVFPLNKTSVDLNIDMIGRVGSEYVGKKDSADYIYVVGDDKLSSDLTPITEQVNSTYSKLKLDRKYNDPKDPERIYFRSDHYNFADKGVPIIFYFNGVHADYHRPTDTPDKINYSLMARRGQLVFYTAWEMANREAMLKRDLKLDRPKGF